MLDVPLCKRLFYLLIGNLGVLIGINTFPTPTQFTFSNWLGKVLFSPFSLLGSIVFFIIGFLTLAYLIRGIIVNGYYKRLSKKDSFIIIGLFFSFLVFLMFNIFAGLLAFVLSVTYGIMDADLKSIYNKYKKLGRN